MDTRGPESRADALANRVVVERTRRCAKSLALLHRSSRFGVSLDFYRSAPGVGVMVFAKMRQSDPRG